MKNILYLFVIIGCAFGANAQTYAGISKNLPGHAFKAQVFAACEETTNGGCMTYGYCELEFGNDSVKVIYSQKKYCSSPESQTVTEGDMGVPVQKYGWYAKGNVIYVKGFDRYGTFEYGGDRLTGTKEVNNKQEGLEFLLE